MDLMTAFYSMLGLGGLGILVWIVNSIRQWGAARERARRADEKRKEAENETAETKAALRYVEKQRDVANRPDRPVADILERMRRGGL